MFGFIAYGHIMNVELLCTLYSGSVQSKTQHALSSSFFHFHSYLHTQTLSTHIQWPYAIRHYAVNARDKNGTTAAMLGATNASARHTAPEEPIYHQIQVSERLD